MDRKAKLAALAQKKREENEVKENDDKPKYIPKSSTKNSKADSKESTPIKSSETNIIRKIKKSASVKPSVAKTKVFKRIREDSPPKRYNRLDNYEEDGFVVDSSDNEIDSESDNLSDDEEEIPKHKKSKIKSSKLKKKSKKSSDSDEENSESESEMDIEDEIAELDTGNIIPSGPGRRTRSSR